MYHLKNGNIEGTATGSMAISKIVRLVLRVLTVRSKMYGYDFFAQSALEPEMRRCYMIANETTKGRGHLKANVLFLMTIT